MDDGALGVRLLEDVSVADEEARLARVLVLTHPAALERDGRGEVLVRLVVPLHHPQDLGSARSIPTGGKGAKKRVCRPASSSVILPKRMSCVHATNRLLNADPCSGATEVASEARARASSRCPDSARAMASFSSAAERTKATSRFALGTTMTAQPENERVRQRPLSLRGLARPTHLGRGRWAQVRGPSRSGLRRIRGAVRGPSRRGVARTSRHSRGVEHNVPSGWNARGAGGAAGGAAVPMKARLGSKMKFRMASWPRTSVKGIGTVLAAPVTGADPALALGRLSATATVEEAAAMAETRRASGRRGRNLATYGGVRSRSWTRR